MTAEESSIRVGKAHERARAAFERLLAAQENISEHRATALLTGLLESGLVEAQSDWCEATREYRQALSDYALELNQAGSKLVRQDAVNS